VTVKILSVSLIWKAWGRCRWPERVHFLLGVTGIFLWGIVAEGGVVSSDLHLPSHGVQILGWSLLVTAAAILLLWRSAVDGKNYDWRFPTLLWLSIPARWEVVSSRLVPCKPLVGIVLPGLVALDIAWFMVPHRWKEAGRNALAGKGAPGVVFLALFVAYMAVGGRLLCTKGFHSGDEAHYLIQAVSLWEDGDLDLANNLGDDFVFTRECFERYHIAPMSSRGQAHSWHPFGLSLLLLPGYVLAGKFGATVTMAALGAAVGALMFTMARRIAGDAATAGRVCATFALTMPQIIYAVRAYPELPAAGAVMLAYYLLMLGDCDRRLWRYLVAGVALGYLPWLLIRRFHAPWLALNAAAVLKLRKRSDLRYWLALLAPQIALIGVLSWINAYRYAGNEVYPDFDGSPITGGLVSLRACGEVLTGLRWLEPDGLVGVFIDKRYGLVWSNLFLVLFVPVAAWTAFRQWRHEWPWLLSFAGVYLVAYGSTFSGWIAGFASHPPRYLVPVLPLLAIPLARLARVRPELWRGGGVRIGLLCAALALTAILRAPYRFECPYYAYARLHPAMNSLAAAFPWLRSAFHPAGVNVRHVAVAAVLTLFLGWLAFSRRGTRVSAAMFFLIAMAAAVISALAGRC